MTEANETFALVDELRATLGALGRDDVDALVLPIVDRLEDGEYVVDDLRYALVVLGGGALT